MKNDNTTGAVFALPQPYFEQAKRPAANTEQAQNAGDDEPAFMPVKPYFETARPTQSSRGTSAQNTSGDEGPTFLPPRPYYVTNEMAALDQLRQRVLELMGQVNRSAEGSAERLAAERSLITARSNLRTAARASESDLQAKLSAMKQPGANDAERRKLEAELASVTDLLHAIDATESDTAPSKATNGAAKANPAAAVLNRAFAIISGWHGGASR